MSKSHVLELVQVYEALFRDALCTYPTLGDEFKMDLARLLRLVEERGIHFLCVDLPSACKHLDRCLSDGLYSTSGLPATRRVSGRVVIPVFLRGLYLKVFTESGCLRSDYDHEAILFLRQILLVGKKVDLDCKPREVFKAIEEFVEVDNLLPEPDQFWSEDCPSDSYPIEFASFASYFDSLEHSGSADKALSVAFTNLDRISGLVSSALGPYRPSEWNFKHGPGAISERTGPVNKYHFVNWSERLESAYPLADCGFHNHLSWVDACDTVLEPGSSEPFSRMISVRKTLTKPRLIAAEPSENQWCQQNLWHYFRERSEATWLSSFISFGDQTLNQKLCIAGSRTGQLATVDLSAASDRLTCHAVQCLFQHNIGLLQALRASRTRYLHQSIHPGLPELMALRKFSTMGSACTFPVESLMFLGVALAAVLSTRKLPVTPSNVASLSGEVAVFGDDIVIPVDSRVLFCRMLEVLHFKINDSKTYWTGKFRESCGVDSYAGVPCTPAYWRSPTTRSPDSIASKVEVTNNFYLKFFVHTAAFLASTVRREYPIPSVSVESGVCGFKSFLGPHSNRHKTRLNGGLQRMEILIPRPTAVVKRSPVTNSTALLQYFTEDPLPGTPWVHGVTQRPVQRVRTGWVPLVDLGYCAETVQRVQ